MNDFDNRLRSSAPVTPPVTPELQGDISRLVSTTRASVTSSRRRRMLWAVPALGLAAAALTGGALAVQTMTADVVLDLGYTNSSGERISCTVELAAGAENVFDDVTASNYLRDRDWTGFGQKVYDRSQANPVDPASVVDSDVPDGWTEAEITPELLANLSWADALSDELNEVATPKLGMGNAWASWSSDDCEGQ